MNVPLGRPLLEYVQIGELEPKRRQKTIKSDQIRGAATKKSLKGTISKIGEEKSDLQDEKKRATKAIISRKRFPASELAKKLQMKAQKLESDRKKDALKKTKLI